MLNHHYSTGVNRGLLDILAVCSSIVRRAVAQYVDGRGYGGGIALRSCGEPHPSN